MSAPNVFEGDIETDEVTSPRTIMHAELALEAAEEALLIAIQSGVPAERAIKTLWARTLRR